MKYLQLTLALFFLSIINLVAQDYHVFETTKLKAFLNQTSSVAGSTNGIQLNSAYDENAPET